MRKPIIAGNWKMYKTVDEAVQFIYQVSDKMPSVEKVDSVICAPFVALKELVKRDFKAKYKLKKQYVLIYFIRKNRFHFKYKLRCT